MEIHFCRNTTQNCGEMRQSQTWTSAQIWTVWSRLDIHFHPVLQFKVVRVMEEPIQYPKTGAQFCLTAALKRVKGWKYSMKFSKTFSRLHGSIIVLLLLCHTTVKNEKRTGPLESCSSLQQPSLIRQMWTTTLKRQKSCGGCVKGHLAWKSANVKNSGSFRCGKIVSSWK